MDKLIQQSMKARGMAQTGGAIERDPQSTFLVPQIARQAQGLPQGANTYPTSPQEPFIGGVPTGSVLENISNAMPQSLQPTSFMQPMDQKKSLDITRSSFADGGDVDWDFISSLEGTKLKGYIPEEKGKPIDQSGVTIGSGFDLGQQNEEGLRKIGISEELIKKFKPYLGKKGLEAQQILTNIPLQISDSENKTNDASC